MIKFLINFQNIKLFIFLLLCLLKLQGVLSACSDNEWDCDDGSCIPFIKQCDGIVDCKDRSDETAENCIHRYRSCATYAFPCTYGACIARDHRCNGIQDCVDNSDELVCSATRQADLQGHCKDVEMECRRSKECISLELMCDGQKDCADASDETVEVCADFRCQEFSFHCGYGACINGDAKCNGTTECLDGSDEAWMLCGTSRKPPNLIPTEVQQTTKNPIQTVTPDKTQQITIPPAGDGCQVPMDVTDLVLKLHFDNSTLLPGDWVLDDDTVHFECKNRAALPMSITHSVYCDRGSFKPAFPTCSTYCDGKLIQGLSTTSQCFANNSGPSSCLSKIPVNTEIRITCAYGYKRSTGNNSPQIVKCLPNGGFDVQREPCILECGIVNRYRPLTKRGDPVLPNEAPWHVAIFQLEEKSYTFICGGSIISPRLVLSAAHCFYTSSNRLQRPEIYYKFMAGKYTRLYDFNTSLEMPQERAVEKIEVSKEYDGKNSYVADVVLVKLKEPFSFNENIAAVCIHFARHSGQDYVQSDWSGFVTGYGADSTSLEQVKMKTEDFGKCGDKSDDQLATDKFCLLNQLDQSVCRGDSGGGFIFKEDKDGYPNRRNGFNTIRGIISFTSIIQNDCARNGHVAVTNVRWIKDDLTEKIKISMQDDVSLF